MFEIIVITYLWLMGAWGHYDLYSSNEPTERVEWFTVIVCVCWPLVLPAALICEGVISFADFLRRTGYGWR